MVAINKSKTWRPTLLHDGAATVHETRAFLNATPVTSQWKAGFLTIRQVTTMVQRARETKLCDIVCRRNACSRLSDIYLIRGADCARLQRGERVASRYNVVRRIGSIRCCIAAASQNDKKKRATCSARKKTLESHACHCLRPPPPDFTNSAINPFAHELLCLSQKRETLPSSSSN